MSDPGPRSSSSAPQEAATAPTSPPSPGPAAAVSGGLTAVLISRAPLAPGIVDLHFSMRIPSRLIFRAGQFVSIAVGDGAGGGPAARRSYSIASASDQGDHLRFIIRVIPDGAASDFLMSLPLGGEVRMTGPHGFFVLDADHAGDLIFGATGTGVSAVMPMLQELNGRPAAGRRVLYWGVRHEVDLFAREEIEALCRQAGCTLHLFLTSPPPGWTAGHGRITQAILADYPGMTAPTFYLVGNGAMISELKGELIALGVNRKKQIRTEAFFD